MRVLYPHVTMTCPGPLLCFLKLCDKKTLDISVTFSFLFFGFLQLDGRRVSTFLPQCDTSLFPLRKGDFT